MTRLCTSVLAGAAACGVSATALAFIHKPSVYAWIAAAFALTAAIFAWRDSPDHRDGEPDAKPSAAEWILFLIFALAACRAFFWLLYSVGEDLQVLSPNNLGDLSLHIDLIKFLAAGPMFWPESPILSGEVMRYPIGMDLLNAVLLKLGVPLREGLIGCGLAASLLTAWMLRMWGGPFALAAFLFNGGLAGFFLIAGAQESDLAVEWKSLFLSLFVTQRGLLFAVPAGLWLLWQWRRRWGGTLPASSLWLEVLLYASLPLFSPHTFLFCSIILGLLVVFSKGPSRRSYLRTGLTSVPLAAWLSWLVTGGFTAGNSIGFHLGWMQKGHPALFWIVNFGIWPALVVWLLVVLWRAKANEEISIARLFVTAAFALFLSGIFIRFAPWPWDNTKLFLWSWIAIAPFLWWHLLSRWHAVAAAATCVTLFFSGALGLVQGLDARHGYTIANLAELREVESQVAGLRGRFACAPAYNHPLILSGKPVALGYEGWLWSHGMEASAEKADLETFMRGGQGWVEAAHRLGLSFVFWGDREEALWAPYGQEWRNSPPQIQGTWGAIYVIP